MDESILEIKFLTETGEVYIARTEEEFDFAMGHKDWCLYFD